MKIRYRELSPTLLDAILEEPVELDGVQVRLTFTLEEPVGEDGPVKVLGMSAMSFDGQELTAKGLRQLKYGWFRESVVAHRQFFHAFGKHADEVHVIGTPPLPRKRAKESGPTPENLEMVAEIYTYWIGSPRPAKHVAEAFGIPRSTATRWIRKARDAGYLEELQAESKEATREAIAAADYHFDLQAEQERGK